MEESDSDGVGRTAHDAVQPRVCQSFFIVTGRALLTVSLISARFRLTSANVAVQELLSVEAAVQTATLCTAHVEVQTGDDAHDGIDT